MQTLLEVLEKSEAFLAKKGVPKAKLDAQWLIADALGYKRLELFLHHDRPLEEAQLEVLRERVRRRAMREPLQHILGSMTFMDLSILCDRRALVPRPETEELADRLVLRFSQKPPSRIADLGTGSGVLALALAKAFPEAEVVAVDQSEEALSLARENAARNGLDRVQFFKSSWFESLSGMFDLIVSNPPYLTQEEWDVAEPEVKTHDPEAALVAEDAGMADLKKILASAPAYLNDGAVLAMETGIAQHDGLRLFAENCGDYASVETQDDLSGLPRYFYAVRLTR